MSPKIRRTGLVRREIGARRLRLYFVATEDTYAAKQYLYALQEKGLVDRSQVEILVFPTEDGRSAPRQLLERLDEKKRGLDVRLEADEFWAVFDVDHHRPKELSEVVMLAKQKGFGLAGSNPCIEVWLLLHETGDASTLVTYDEDSSAADICEKELRRVLGQYNKKNIDVTRLSRRSVDEAIRRAEAMDDGAPWPTAVGTHMHRLVKRLPL